MPEIPTIPRDDSSWMSTTCRKKARNTGRKDVTAAYNSPKEDTDWDKALEYVNAIEAPIKEFGS